jgi:hypothetical protein
VWTGLNWLTDTSYWGTGIVGWIKLADYYFVLGNKGLLTGLNWLTVASYWGTGIVEWIKLTDCYFVLGNMDCLLD